MILDTQIFVADTSILKDEDAFSTYYSKVSNYRQRKVDRCYFKKDKDLSLMAGLLLICALRYSGISRCAENVFLGKFGKPRLRESPNVFYNLSHSGHYAICALSSIDVGCDIEEVLNIDYRVLSEQFFSKEETLYIDASSNDAENLHRFFQLWTHKESYVKMIGAGISSSIIEIPVISQQEMKSECIMNGETVYFKDFVLPGHCISCCSTRQNISDEIIPLTQDSVQYLL